MKLALLFIGMFKQKERILTSRFYCKHVFIFIYVTGLCCIISPLLAAPAFGTYDRLFSASSLWNSRPVNPVLGISFYFFIFLF